MADLPAPSDDWTLDARTLQDLRELLGHQSLTSAEARQADQILGELSEQLADAEARNAEIRLDQSIGQLIVSDTDVRSGDAYRTARDALEALRSRLASMRHDDPFAAWDSTMTVPPREWLVDQWLPHRRLTMLTGLGGLGKSRLTLQLLAGIVMAFRTFVVGQQHPSLEISGDLSDMNVMLASWEDEQTEVHRRLTNIMSSWSSGQSTYKIDALNGRFFYQNMRGRGPLWAPQGMSGHIATLGGPTDLSRQLRQTCIDNGVGLLVIDSVAAAYGSDENVRALVRAFLGDWDMWADEVGCAVLLIGHPPKSGSEYSGSTDWHNAVRNLWTLGREVEKLARGSQSTPGEAVVLRCLKSNYGPIPDPVPLELDQMGVWDEMNRPSWLI